MRKRIYKENVPQHVFFRGKDGGIIFYCMQDCIYYITLYSCLSERHGIVTNAFSLMPNHAHKQQQAGNRQDFTAFNSEFSAKYTRGYNKQHRRSGELFDNPFGSYPKSTGKLIRSNLSYICNNGAVGKLSKGVIDYRWNMMAYYHNRSPFSDGIKRDRISKRFRCKVKMVDYLRKTGTPLDYSIQVMLYDGLGKAEKSQLTDYILAKYNPVDYRMIELSFGSFEKALAGMEANTGSEHDIQEDWEDYSVFKKLGLESMKKGIDLQTINFEMMNSRELFELRLFLKKKIAASEKQLDKFLHMNVAHNPPDL